MSIDIKTSTSVKSIINDKVIKDASFKSHYDGKDLEIKGYSDGELFYMKLDNEEIKDILALPSNDISLEERLIKDFGKNKKSNQTRKKTNKKNSKKNTKKTNKKTTKKNTKK